MNNQKSIIGQNYNAKGLTAFDLERNTRADLGKRPYIIVRDPYLSDYKGFEIFPSPFMPREAVFVNVLDERTGRTYKVVYEPANLLTSTTPNESKTDKSKEQTDFVKRARQIIEELNEIFNNGGISEKCGVAFFSISDNGDGKTSSAHSFLGGRGDRIIDCIATCAENPNAVELVEKGVIKAIRRIMDGVGKNKDDNE